MFFLLLLLFLLFSLQIVNDDIEAIESTIPRLEAFNSSYSVVSSSVSSCGRRLREFGTSATTSDGVASKRSALKVGIIRTWLDGLANVHALETPLTVVPIFGAGGECIVVLQSYVPFLYSTNS